MDEALISVVIPTYNYGHFVTGAVESALAQTYPDREVIVVDDGSTDDTRDRLAPFEGRIRYIHQENRGLSAARNTGIRAARGALIAFLDSDDLWHPEKLAVQARYLAEHPKVALLASDHLDMHTSEIGEVDWPPVDGAHAIQARAISFEQLVIGSRFGACGVVARKWCFDEVGFFDETLRSAEDVDMWIRIASRFAVARLEFPLWVYRHHGTSMHRATARMELNTLKMIGKVFDGPEPLSRSPRLRRKALAQIIIQLAYGYRDAHAYGAALSRIVRSLLLWPFPYPDKELWYCHPRVRLKFLTLATAQAARWHLGLSRSRRDEEGAVGARFSGEVADGARALAADLNGDV
jgi:glycosyltransferase involved in cell wall biosynthesis